MVGIAGGFGLLCEIVVSKIEPIEGIRFSQYYCRGGWYARSTHCRLRVVIRCWS